MKKRVSIRAKLSDWTKRLKFDLRIVLAIQIALILWIIGGFYVAIAAGESLGIGGVLVLIPLVLIILGYLGLLEVVLMKIVSGFLSAFTVFLTFMLFLATSFFGYHPRAEGGIFLMWCCFLLGLFLLKIVSIGPVKYFTYTSGILALGSLPFLMEPFKSPDVGLLVFIYVVFAFVFGYLAVSVKNAIKNAFKIQTGAALILANLMLTCWFMEGMYDKTFLASLLVAFAAFGFLFMYLSAIMARKFASLKTSGKDYIAQVKRNALMASLLISGAFFFSAFFINLIWFADLFLKNIFWEVLALSSACATLIACVLSFINRSLSPVMDPVGAFFGIVTIAATLESYHFRTSPTLSFLLFILFSTLVYFARNRGGLWGLGILASGFGVVTQFAALESLGVAQTTVVQGLIVAAFFLIALLMSIAVFYLPSSAFSKVLLVQNGTATIIVAGFVIDRIHRYAYTSSELLGLGILFLAPAFALGWLAFRLSRKVMVSP